MQLKTDLNDHVALVYVLGADPEGPVKIGRTTQLPERLVQLQIGSPYALEVYGFRFIAAPPSVQRTSLRYCFAAGAAALERAVHRKLDEFGLRLSGEWFDLSAEEALAVIGKLIAPTGVRAVGLTDLAAVDLTGRADGAVARAHAALLHEAVAINAFVQGHNKPLAEKLDVV